MTRVGPLARSSDTQRAQAGSAGVLVNRLVIVVSTSFEGHAFRWGAVSSTAFVLKKREPPLKNIHFPLALLAIASLSACTTVPDQMSSSSEICDVKEPVLGSRVTEKVRCAPPKKAAAPSAG